jgi:hypothetical protein
MPTEELHLFPLREVRAKKRKALGNTHPSVIYFQVSMLKNFFFFVTDGGKIC